MTLKREIKIHLCFLDHHNLPGWDMKRIREETGWFLEADDGGYFWQSVQIRDPLEKMINRVKIKNKKQYRQACFVPWRASRQLQNNILQVNHSEPILSSWIGRDANGSSELEDGTRQRNQKLDAGIKNHKSASARRRPTNREITVSLHIFLLSFRKSIIWIIQLDSTFLTKYV